MVAEMSELFEIIKGICEDHNRIVLKIGAKPEARFKIGTKYTARGKQKRECTVTDILKTYNSAGELVKIRYVATHEFCGQIITEHDVVETTIAMGNPNVWDVGGQS